VILPCTLLTDTCRLRFQSSSPPSVPGATSAPPRSFAGSPVSLRRVQSLQFGRMEDLVPGMYFPSRSASANSSRIRLGSSGLASAPPASLDRHQGVRHVRHALSALGMAAWWLLALGRSVRPYTRWADLSSLRFESSTLTSWSVESFGTLCMARRWCWHRR
jgi:hypothetical protein